jgi:lysozyme
VRLPSRALGAAIAIALLAGCASAPEEDVGSSDLAVTVCGQTTVKGIDVYHGDNGGNPIDWAQVKAAGMSFAFAKATESTNFTDSAFATNWPAMKAAGLKRGAYHFFHADVDPVAQANFFLATVGPLSPGDLLVLDMETTNGQTQATIAAHAVTFLETVHSATGTTPLLYTSPLFLSSYPGLGAFPLWIANYGVSCPMVPAEWSTYVFWQSGSTGSITPISGAVDLDSFNGTLADLAALGVPDGGAGDADAGADASTDAAPEGGATSDAGPAWPSRGCGCSVVDGRRGASPRLAGLALALLALRRKRRTGASVG